MKTTFLIAAACVVGLTVLGLNSCAPGSTLTVNPDGSISFTGTYTPKAKQVGVVQVVPEK